MYGRDGVPVTEVPPLFVSRLFLLDRDSVPEFELEEYRCIALVQGVARCPVDEDTYACFPSRGLPRWDWRGCKADGDERMQISVSFLQALVLASDGHLRNLLLACEGEYENCGSAETR